MKDARACDDDDDDDEEGGQMQCVPAGVVSITVTTIMLRRR